MNKEKKVSVIIPVYNSEKYIQECINSVLNQTYENIEIILIDDGSTDESLKICNKYANEYEGISCYRQKNTGVSAARNFGIKCTHGDYIIFVDSDDYLNKDYIKYMVECLEKNSDCNLCSCDFYLIDQDGLEIKTEKKLLQSKILSLNEYMKCLFNSDLIGYQGYLWNKIFVASIIKQNRIRFNESIYYNEDRLFICQYLLYCNSIGIDNKKLYYYRQHSTSAMGRINCDFSNKMLTEIDAYEEMKQLLYTHNINYVDLIIEEFYSSLRIRRKLIYKRDKKNINKIILKNLIYICKCKNISSKIKINSIVSFLKQKYHNISELIRNK